MKLFALGLALHLMDWQQTRSINYNDFHETNIVLGKYPSKQKIDQYFLATGLGIGLANLAFPKHRKMINIYWSFIELSYVTHNINIGVRF